MNTESSPFVFNVGTLVRGSAVPASVQQTGSSPVRIGPAMIAIPENGDVTVNATITPLGDALMVDADVSAELSGECVRCLRHMAPQAQFHVNEVFALTEDFITGDDGDGEEDDVTVITGDTVDILQAVIDEAGMSLPFNPQCEGGCVQSDSDVPEPDGIAGETELVDPRWAGLEKFL